MLQKNFYKQTLVSLLSFFIFPLALVLSPTPSFAKTSPTKDRHFTIATFDSGFGGYFTAKEIEKESHDLRQNYQAQFTINHYGDTKNAPYGEKSFEDIAQFAAQGIRTAFNGGADKVFIACNTASTQFDRIREILDAQTPGLSKNVVSIIETSVTELKRLIDVRFQSQKHVRAGIFATPATQKAAAYPKALAKAYGVTLPTYELSSLEKPRWYQLKGKSIQNVWGHVTLAIPPDRSIDLYFMGPGNWVDMIEHGAKVEEKSKMIGEDLKIFSEKFASSQPLDVVGEFCTHYPAVDALIREQGASINLINADTKFIKQGPLMGQLFKSMMLSDLVKQKRKQPRSTLLASDERARIFISGTNVDETKELARSIFSTDPVPSVTQLDFSKK